MFGLLNHFLLFRCVWARDYEVAEKVLPPPAASCERASRAHRAVRGHRACPATPGEGDELRGDRAPGLPSPALPARSPGLPQRVDETVDRTLRVQGHDIPYIEEAGHFIGHAASCSEEDVPFSSQHPRRPLRGAAAAEAERSARLQPRTAAAAAVRHGQRDRPAPGELPGPEPQLRRPQDARRPDAGRAAAAASPAGFLFLSELFSPTPLLLLLAPPLPPPRTLRAPSRRSPPPGPSCCLQSLWVPSGKFLDQVVVPIGRRGAEERGDKEAEANQAAAAGGGARPGRDDFRGRGTRPPGKPRRARTERGEALEGRQSGPRAGKLSLESRPGVARLRMRQFPPGKAKDTGVQTGSRVLKGAGSMRIGDGAGALDPSRLSQPHSCRWKGGVRVGWVRGMGYLLTEGEKGGCWSKGKNRTFSKYTVRKENMRGKEGDSGEGEGRVCLHVELVVKIFVSSISVRR